MPAEGGFRAAFSLFGAQPIPEPTEHQYTN